MKKLFKQAYQDEKLTSGILLQRFLTGLMAPVSQQILLHGQPTTFEQAVENAKEMEYALNFETKHTEPGNKDINVINKTHPMEDQTLTTQLQQALDQMIKRLEALEIRLQPIAVNQTVRDRNPLRNQQSNIRTKYALIADHNHRPCW